MHSCNGASATASLCSVCNTLLHFPVAPLPKLFAHTHPTDARSSGYSGINKTQQDAAENSTTPSSDAPGTAGSSAPALKPGTSAFAAAGATPLDADTGPAGGQDQQQHKAGPVSPHRPPLHPTKHASEYSLEHTTASSADKYPILTRGGEAAQLRQLLTAGQVVRFLAVCSARIGSRNTCGQLQLKPCFCPC